MKDLLCLARLIGAIFLVSCGSVREELEPQGIVLSPGFSVEAVVDNALIRVSWLGPTSRRITIGDESRVVNARIRKIFNPDFGWKWSGLSGIYDPGEGWYSESDIRTQFSESQVSFPTASDLRKYLISGSAVYARIFDGRSIILRVPREPMGPKWDIGLFEIRLDGHQSIDYKSLVDEGYLLTGLTMSGGTKDTTTESTPR